MSEVDLVTGFGVAIPIVRNHCRRGTQRLLARMFVVAVAAMSPVVVLAQSTNSKGSAAGDVYSASAVDAVAARIKQDLKDLKPAPSTTPDGPASVPDAKGSSKPSKDASAKTNAASSTRQIKSARVRAVEAVALKCLTADEAFVLYQIFLADPATTADDREEARPRIQYWEQAATDQLVRVGAKWMPKEEADALQKQADKLVAEALELLNVDNAAAANAKLEQAGKVYPEHLESSFLLAVGAYQNQEVKAAETRFAQCLVRAPNHLPLLNNVAVCEVSLKRYDKAVKHWEKAAQIDPENKDVAQNLGQFISDASTKRITGVERRVLTDATNSYQIMVARDSRNRSDSSLGYVLTKEFRPGGGSANHLEDYRDIGLGTGFVVADGFVLTNRHVLDDAEAIVVQDPAKPDDIPWSARLVATAKELDLVLIECLGLKAPPVATTVVRPSRGDEVMALSFPAGIVTGNRLKGIRGSITGLPSDATEQLLVLDVKLNPGNSGGPLCDKSGRVIGIVAAKSYTTVLADAYGLAMPFDDVTPFLKQYIRDYKPPGADAAPLEWSEVETRVGQSTVMILTRKKR